MKPIENQYPREQRALGIVAEADEMIKWITPSSWGVKSKSGDFWYLVNKEPSGWKCNCPDFVYRKIKCKHILAVKYWLRMKRELPKKSEITQPKEEVRCRFCNSTNVVKHGFRKAKVRVQRYRCKDCKRKFVVDKGFAGMKNDPKIITLSLDLYFKGISLRKIVDHLKQFHGIEISHMAIHKWIRKYVQVIKRHVDKLTPNVSEIWHSDEMALNVKGGWKWLWNLIDHKSKFLIASNISENRAIGDARKLFERGKKIAKKHPAFIVTDGLPTYKDACRREFYTRMAEKTEHVSLANITGFVNNNIVERLHGTIRERNKVMRGLGNNGSAPEILEGFKIYYNFIRPHMGLNGRTPAEAAGINLGLNGGNRWLELIRKGANHNNSNNQISDGGESMKPSVIFDEDTGRMDK